MFHIPNEGKHFNPFPSCEGRHGGDGHTDTPHEFQSTPLMRGETQAAGMG